MVAGGTAQKASWGENGESQHILLQSLAAGFPFRISQATNLWIAGSYKSLSPALREQLHKAADKQN